MVIKPSKHQSSKQRFQDLCWKVHRNLLLFRSDTLHELRNENIPTAGLVKQPLCSVQGQGQRRRKNMHTTKNFVEFHNHSPQLCFDKVDEWVRARVLKFLHILNHYISFLVIARNSMYSLPDEFLLFVAYFSKKSKHSLRTVSLLLQILRKRT